MRYITDDGEEYTANNEAELVDAMRATSWSQAPDAASWMKDTAAQLKEGMNFDVAHDTPGNFVRDLIRCGLLKEAPDEPAAA